MTIPSNKALIPREISDICTTLEEAGYLAYIVGGCLRDLILGNEPKDWDITTNAKPEAIISLFPKTFYENSFGTVGVVNENTSTPSLKIVEVTPFRKESSYTDNRHPDQVEFVSSLEDDLARRDFTMNAIAAPVKNSMLGDIIDPFDGLKDIKNKLIKAVGNAEARFKEDALRMMRAIRFVSQLGFAMDLDTSKAIVSCKTLIDNVSHERIRDELNKIILSPSPMIGIVYAEKLGILDRIIPELTKSIGVTQNQAHKYDVWEHLLRSLQCAADKNYDLETRLAALFHDISKPETRKISRETNQYTFYGHEVVGSRVTRKILARFNYSSKTIDKVVTLVRWHMFFSDTEQITLSAVRRMVVNVGRENIWDLMNVRICDRIGTGRPKEDPYRLRKYHAMIEQALRDPISVGMLKIDGKRIMEVTGEVPGPKVGFILHALLEEVIEDSELNGTEILEKKAINLAKLSLKELEEMGKKGVERKKQAEEEEVGKIHMKHRVK